MAGNIPLKHRRFNVIVYCLLLFLAGLLLPRFFLGLLSEGSKEQHAFILQYGLSAFQEIMMLGLPALLLYMTYYGKKELFNQFALPDSYQAGLSMISAVSFTLAGSLLVVFWLAILTSFGYEPFVPMMHNPVSPLQYVGAFIFAALIPAVSEELLFRGVLLRLIKQTKGEKAALYLTSILFAVLHLSVEGFPALLVIGGLLAKMALKYNGLFLPILFHMVYNMAAIVINASNTVPSLQAMLLCVAVFVLSVRALMRDGEQGKA